MTSLTVRRLVIGIVAAIVVLVSAAAGVAYWQASTAIDQLHAGPKGAVVRAVRPELHRAPARTLVRLPPEPSAQTILLIGSDHRWQGGTGARSDTIMLARLQHRLHDRLLELGPSYHTQHASGETTTIVWRYANGAQMLLRDLVAFPVVRDTLRHYVEDVRSGQFPVRMGDIIVKR